MTVRTTAARLVREPLLQFLVAGGALFGAYGLATPQSPGGEPSHRIELTEDDLRRIRIAWLAQGRPELSPEQMQRLVEARVREEILYREALALGLDQGDEIVRRRMAQKMEFLFEDVAALREPAPAELRAWYERNAERFTQPGRATFRHLYFSPDRRGARAREDAERALGQLGGEPAASPGLADPFMFQDYYPDRAFDDVAKAFGAPFAEALFRLAPGAWAGPLESGYGWHLVWIESITPARVPSLEEVEPNARTGWVEEQRTEIRERAFAAMRARYEVVLPKARDAGDLATRPSSEAPPLTGIAPQ